MAAVDVMANRFYIVRDSQNNKVGITLDVIDTALIRQRFDSVAPERGYMVDFDELVAWPGRGTHIALGHVIHEIKSGWAPPSLHVDLFRAQGCEPAIYTMADIDRFAALSEFKAWLVVHKLASFDELVAPTDPTA
jgi:hypothetical protein